MQFDLDKDTSLFKPLEFIIDGQKFTTVPITRRIMDKVGKEKDINKQFSIFMGVKLEDTLDLSHPKVIKATRTVMSEYIKWQINLGAKVDDSNLEILKNLTPEELEKNKQRPGPKR